MLRNTVVVVVAIGIMAAGCGAPEPPVKVSAYLPDNRALLEADPNACEDANAVVVARCMQTKEYATMVEGEHVNSWYLTIWRVISVERGKWPRETVSFIFRDKWPLPREGMKVKKLPVPYYVGAIRAFCIDTTGKPTIVSAERRSQIPPHDPITRPTYNADDPDVPVLYERVYDAAREFVWKERKVTGAMSVVEQYGRSYVVEVRTESNTYAVVVDAESMTVKWADPAEASK